MKIEAKQRLVANDPKFQKTVAKVDKLLKQASELLMNVETRALPPEDQKYKTHLLALIGEALYRN